MDVDSFIIHLSDVRLSLIFFCIINLIRLFLKMKMCELFSIGFVEFKGQFLFLFVAEKKRYLIIMFYLLSILYIFLFQMIKRYDPKI